MKIYKGYQSNKKDQTSSLVAFKSMVGGLPGFRSYFRVFYFSTFDPKRAALILSTETRVTQYTHDIHFIHLNFTCLICNIHVSHVQYIPYQKQIPTFGEIT